MTSTDDQRRVLAALVEAYPGFIVVGGGTGTNPVRGKFGALLGGPQSGAAAKDYIRHIQEISDALRREFPDRFPATKRTLAEDVAWMRAQLGAGEGTGDSLENPIGIAHCTKTTQP